MYRMNFNKEGPIDPNLFNMCEEAHAYYQMECLIAEMSRVKIDVSYELDQMADEIRDYFDDEAEPMDTD